MSRGKRLGWTLLLSVAATLGARPAASHTGDESSQGCHTDVRTGDYHCHTPKTPQPGVEVTLVYCHVLRGQSRCGQTLAGCRQLLVQFSGSCQPQLGAIAR